MNPFVCETIKWNKEKPEAKETEAMRKTYVLCWLQYVFYCFTFFIVFFVFGELYYVLGWSIVGTNALNILKPLLLRGRKKQFANMKLFISYFGSIILFVYFCSVKMKIFRFCTWKHC